MKRLIPIGLLAVFAIMSGDYALGGSMTSEDLLTPDVVHLLETGGVHADVWRDNTRDDAAMDVFSAVNIAASPEMIWTVMTDCDRSLEIVDKMKSCRITAQGEGWDIREQKLRSGIVTTTSVFRSDYDFPRTIRISKAGGDMEVQEGVWRLEPVGDGITRVSYRAASCPSFPVPSGLLKRAMKKDVPEILRRLRDAAEGDAG
jgi:hypothetical protein